jgi:GMP synthase-like glutamine amidotransferase
VLGICYGMQTMAAQLGGAVAGSPTSEFGYAQIRARGVVIRCFATSATTWRRTVSASSTYG